MFGIKSDQIKKEFPASFGKGREFGWHFGSWKLQRLTVVFYPGLEMINDINHHRIPKTVLATNFNPSGRAYPWNYSAVQPLHDGFGSVPSYQPSSNVPGLLSASICWCTIPEAAPMRANRSHNSAIEKIELYENSSVFYWMNELLTNFASKVVVYRASVANCNIRLMMLLIRNCQQGARQKCKNEVGRGFWYCWRLPKNLPLRYGPADWSVFIVV